LKQEYQIIADDPIKAERFGKLMLEEGGGGISKEEKFEDIDLDNEEEEEEESVMEVTVDEQQYATGSEDAMYEEVEIM
jgi:hypothetical protein